jgi:hypothetical protein
MLQFITLTVQQENQASTRCAGVVVARVWGGGRRGVKGIGMYKRDMWIISKNSVGRPKPRIHINRIYICGYLPRNMLKRRRRLKLEDDSSVNGRVVCWLTLRREMSPPSSGLKNEPSTKARMKQVDTHRSMFVHIKYRLGFIQIR